METPEKKATNNKPLIEEPMVLNITIKPTWADVRYDLHALSDALIVAPKADRKFANDIIKIIKNTIKISRPKNATIKKNGFNVTVYDVDELRLEIENKLDNDEHRNYLHPRIITVINRKTGKIVDRITKPFLVAKVFLVLTKTHDKIIESKKTLDSVQGAIKKISERQTQK
jgi:hypothetical protein